MAEHLQRELNSPILGLAQPTMRQFLNQFRLAFRLRNCYEIKCSVLHLLSHTMTAERFYNTLIYRIRTEEEILLIIIVRDADTYYKVASFMFGAGISLASTRFLLYFLKLTGHCQRGTAQNTYMLSRECGYALGLVLALMIPVALETALVLILLSVALYLFVTHPWFMRHGDRGFKFREV